METMDSYDGAFLVMDDQERIFRQYRKQLSGFDSSWKWVQNFLSRNRVHHYKRAVVPRPIKVALVERGFVREDYDNYVRTAAASNCRIVVTHDPDFQSVRLILKRGLGVDARGSSQARCLMTGDRCPSCGD
jgi:hypothetical protein